LGSNARISSVVIVRLHGLLALSAFTPGGLELT
jgi:hypothetical protein